MDLANAFIGRANQPSHAEVITALGTAAPLWSELIEEVSSDGGNLTQEWKGIVVNKYGWSLRLKQKSRNIIFMSPCHNCFKVAFTLSDKAVTAAKEAHLPKAVVEALATAPRYPEGTGLRLTVNRPADLPAIRKIARIKLAN
ncbi:DUF3788 domain-containing protein [Occallatibacter riparius]|uniref:DUF3788 domain-containing protein n=1 Tax=Occallatibacter riparius TaxID=1002689 RepID=A0A9J7BUZ6_9BACT|nr:DUF3788 domain-containing protein [Occallatibacter riparius]UWZ86699.1 DUF3788 domain-containing protein [Occallatibacter riparius]